MINPDGVCVGNNRTSLSGIDLNRDWDEPDLLISPEINAIKCELLK